MLSATSLCKVGLAGADERADALKAAYVFYFARFTQWQTPGTADDELARVINLCILSANSNLVSEFKIVASKSLTGNTPLQLTYYNSSDIPKAALAACEILYIGEGFSDDQLHLAAGDLPGVLVVTDGLRGAGKGTIHFVLSGNKLGFEIDRRRERASQLQISSKLLRLATKVVD